MSPCDLVVAICEFMYLWAEARPGKHVCHPVSRGTHALVLATANDGRNTWLLVLVEGACGWKNGSWFEQVRPR